MFMLGNKSQFYSVLNYTEFLPKTFFPSATAITLIKT